MTHVAASDPAPAVHSSGAPDHTAHINHFHSPTHQPFLTSPPSDLKHHHGHPSPHRAPPDDPSKGGLPLYLSSTGQAIGQDGINQTHRGSSIRRGQSSNTSRVLSLALFLAFVLAGAFVVIQKPSLHRGFDGFPHPPWPLVKYTGLKANPGPVVHGCGPSRPPHRPDNPELEPPPQRNFTLHEPLGTITGNFDLYDYLELTSLLGGIDITITPRPGIRPAVLKLTSNVGPIKVRLADQFLLRAQRLTGDIIQAAVDADGQRAIHGDLVDADDLEELMDTANSISRVFDTEIVSRVGSVTASYLIGNGGTTRATGQVGALNLDLYAVGVGPQDPVTTLITTTQPGAQTVTVSALSRFGGPVSNLRGIHTGQGLGLVDVTYPLEWEGRVTATVQGLGKADVDGRGLVIDTANPETVEAHRGRSDVGVTLTAQGTGGLKFRC